MEPRTFRWVSDLDLDEAGFMLQQELINQLNQFSGQEMAATSLDQHKDIQQSLSSESSTLCSSIFSVGNMERAQRVDHNRGEPCLLFVPDAPLLLSFDHHQPQPNNITNGGSHAKDHGSKRKKLASETESKKMKMDIMKQPAFVHDHIMAERRRREKLSQRFIELAAIIPGLKKMDKASVLGDAIKHIKVLEEKVKTLDDKLVKKTVETVTINMKLHDDSNDCQRPISSVENNSINVSSFDDQKPHPHEIQVKISEKAVLVKVHCENHKGVLALVISKIEELHLKITNISAVPFLGSNFLDITVAAQIDEEGCSITVTDVVKNLNSGMRNCNG